MRIDPGGRINERCKLDPVGLTVDRLDSGAGAVPLESREQDCQPEHEQDDDAAWARRSGLIQAEAHEVDGFVHGSLAIHGLISQESIP